MPFHKKMLRGVDYKGSAFIQKTCFYLFLFAILLNNNQIKAQTPLLDSLKAAYINEEEDTSKILILIEIAYQNRNTNPDTTILLATQALNESEKLNYDKGIAWAWHRMAFSYWLKGRFPEALDYAQKSLSLFEKIQDKKGAATSLNTLGLIYNSQKNYPKALEYYQESLEIREKIGDKQGASVSLNNIGNTFDAQGNYSDNIGNTLDAQRNYSEALKYFQKSLEIQQEIGYEQGMATSFNNMGNIYMAQRNYPKALEYYQKGLGIYEKVGDQRGMTYALLGIARVYLKQKDYENSIAFAKKSLEIALEIHTLDEAKEAGLTLYESYKLKGDYKKALEYHELYKQINDSLFNSDNAKKIANLESKSEIERKELEILKEKEAKEFQQYINYLVIAGLGMMMIFSFLIFRSRQQEKKAKELISQQKEEVQQINEELHQASELIHTKSEALEEINKEITDSISYAQRIQKAMLPTLEFIQSYIPELFILFKPRDIVSGDFYYFAQKENRIVIAAVDCTGHGVPGAFMSMIGNDILNNLVEVQGITEANLILNELHKGIRQVLKQGQTENRDGMDVSLIVIDKESKSLEFAGAKNSLIYISNAQLFVIKGDNRPIGGEQNEEERLFKKHHIDLSDDMVFYLFSDGYQDQFGGIEKKKFMVSQMKELLIAIHRLPLEEQRQILNQKIEDWMAIGGEKQIDDMLLIGFRL